MEQRNQAISPYFQEDNYKGQDVVHYGVRIPLTITPQEALEKFSRNAQRICTKFLPGMFRELRQEDLSILREMWFDPSDVTFPSEMGKHVGLVALNWESKVIGGAIWSPEGNNLFLHQLVSGKEGKEAQMPTRLIWESVNAYHGKYHSLDIGVSYNPKRYAFFLNFAVEKYPIILKKPFYIPVIRLSPFRSLEALGESKGELGENVTFLPRGNYALYAALKHIGVKQGDEVAIVKTFGSDFISGCVTSTIEKTGATWTLSRAGIKDNTKAVVCLHEFGVPVFQERDMQMLAWARENNVPVIEDCAWRWSKVFTNSQYAIFSCQKIFNMNYGGLLDGAKISDEQLWEWGCLDVVKRERYAKEKDLSIGLTQRVANWTLYHELVKADGMMSDDCIDWEQKVKDGWMPTVYMQKFATDEIANDIVKRLEDFGIQAGRYWGEPNVYLPIHQNMSLEEVEYMFAVVRGYFNLCRDYKGATIIQEESHG